MGPLLAASAHRAQEGLERCGFLLVGGNVAGRKQPVQFLLLERAGEPAQRQVRCSRQGDLAQGDAQRELEEGAESRPAKPLLFSRRKARSISPRRALAAWTTTSRRALGLAAS